VHLQEHILRELFGPGPIGHAPRRQPKDQAFVLVDQLAKCSFIALPAPLDQLVLGACAHSPSAGLERGAKDFVSPETIAIVRQSNLPS
jgi:hypothetical protein